MTTEYKVGAIADILNQVSPSKKSKKEKSTLFDSDVAVDVKPVYKPYVMPKVENNVDSSSKESEDEVKVEKKSVKGKDNLLSKREKGMNRADDEIQRRKEKKIRKKEEKRKLSASKDETEDNKSNFVSQKAGTNLEAEERTIFVGNLPITIKRFQLKKIFSKIGPIDSVRIRSAAISKQDISKRVAVLRQEFHPERTSINGFVVFNSKEHALKALNLNGTVYEGHHLRVDLSNKESSPDHKHSVFVGNLSFKIEEEALWETFGDCGKIKGVRLIRDKETGIGKGFGYVIFDEKDSVELALKLSTTELNGRKIRVSRSKEMKNKKEGKNKVAIDKNSKRKNKGKSFIAKDGANNKFQGVAAKKGLKLKLAKKSKNVVKQSLPKKKKKSNKE